ncbi:hypothetical protein HPB48_012333 [Haemaphysalis longicornis]|uniref:26S proteasome non-ATPase regulatory subunit 3 N-terminal TPR repeats domain-containing protein n=1 Tax=Haemaphysalis longicornis TaxID=44386 RepID=A0A9J6G3C9_HAELO|nr:hypothetical protein HPB48_012333 [Haemaphysalis longicornis]
MAAATTYPGYVGPPVLVHQLSQVVGSPLATRTAQLHFPNLQLFYCNTAPYGPSEARINFTPIRISPATTAGCGCYGAKTVDNAHSCGRTSSTVHQDIKEHARHIEKAVNSKEPRFILRILRALMPTRKRLNAKVMRKIVTGFFTHSSQHKDSLLAFLDEPMETDGAAKEGRIRSAKTSHLPLLPELDVYIHLLVLVHLIDSGRFEQAVKCSDQLMQKIQAQNRRTLDLLASKCYFYHSRCYELTGQMSSIRSFLHSRLRTATLRSDYEGQAVLVNCLLRNYLHYNLYEQASKLVSKSAFPDAASNNEWARYLYYLGRIRAIQLDYSEARRHLLQAIRKAPQHAALGFKQTGRGPVGVEGSKGEGVPRARTTSGPLPDYWAASRHQLDYSEARRHLLQAIRKDRSTPPWIQADGGGLW